MQMLPQTSISYKPNGTLRGICDAYVMPMWCLCGAYPDTWWVLESYGKPI